MSASLAGSGTGSSTAIATEQEAAGQLIWLPKLQWPLAHCVLCLQGSAWTPSTGQRCS